MSKRHERLLNSKTGGGTQAETNWSSFLPLAKREKSDSKSTDDVIKSVLDGLILYESDYRLVTDNLTTFLAKIESGAIICGDESDDYADWPALLV